MPEPVAVEWFDRPWGEPVELHEPSPRWRELAEEWSAAIGTALAPLRPRIEHIGSTAVPGLVAKPVIDLQVSVPDVAEGPASGWGWKPSAWCCGPGNRDTASSGRRPPAGEPRVVHVHVCGQGSDWEREHLLFRDELRARSDLLAAYARLEQDLAGQVGSDRSAYTEGKASFVRRVVEFADRR